MAKTAQNITAYLSEHMAGDDQALIRLVPLVYEHLRRIARNQMRKESPNHTLTPTALVNEAFMELCRVKKIEWQGREHFFALAARIMRQLLVQHARRKNAKKRAHGIRVTFSDSVAAPDQGELVDILSLDEALAELEKAHERRCRVVEMRYFAGMTLNEVAHALNVSVDTVKTDWAAAKAWLYVRLGKLRVE